MNFINFESGRDKEQARQQLREAREQMLEQAKQRAELRAQREALLKLSGESNWMLPAVAKKFETSKAKSRKSKTAKKQNKKTKKPKKSKKTHKERKHNESSSEEDPSSDEYSSDDEPRKHKKGKLGKKRRSKWSSESSKSASSSTTDSSDSDDRMLRNKRTRNDTTSSSSSSSESSDEWVEKKVPVIEKEPKQQAATSISNKAETEKIMQRDDWMTGGGLDLKTFSRERAEKKPNEQQQITAYDPKKSARELNPYWRSTGTGLPGFQKPKDDDDSDDELEGQWKNVASSSSRQAGDAPKRWQKRNDDEKEERIFERKESRVRSSSSGTDSEDVPPENQGTSAATADASSFLTDQQMNELGAKIVKAEIMGNDALAKELKEKLEEAREKRAVIKDHKQEQLLGSRKQANKRKASDEQHVLLTRTDERGNCRPLQTTVDPRDLYGGRSGRKKPQKRMETHADGERMRYFADDDKYDIKQMFEREKYSSAAESNLQFAGIAGKHKNPNDDLDDIFADTIRKDVSEKDEARREYQRAVHEHTKMAKQLDNCYKCFDSDKMDKKLLVSMGDKVYLMLPWHVGLQPGHCVIAPTNHVSCCTQLDEDTWEEMNNFRKAITKMFAAQQKDVVFFETANKLQRYPHLSIHCVPIPATEGEMAPFYFKKAIEESEHEWSVNKQLVSLRADKGLRNCIPKGLPYFWVNFGMDSGFAHVIEDQERFPVNYAQEILGGLLHLDANSWRRPQKEQNVIAKVKMFADMWKKYDCTT